MRLGTAALLIAILGVAGLAYLLTSEEFGRPAQPERAALRSPITWESPVGAPHRAEFTICSGPIRANCVVDGDTFWFEGVKIRIADIDAPEISEPACADEAKAGEMAKARLLDLLNGGRFRLIAGWRDEDRFGRKLRVVSRGDVSLGELLVREGLARRGGGPDRGWCS